MDRNLGPLNTREGTGRKYNEAVASFAQDAQDLSKSGKNRWMLKA